MYRWYQKASICFVHLADFVTPLERRGHPIRLNDEKGHGEVLWRLRQCRWFNRGWTLQELIAPNRVVFFDLHWNYLFRKDVSTALQLSSITGIHENALNGTKSLSNFSIAQRMYWASKRRTTRVEDEAYSLLGLFDINMPLLYGEGTRAFRRLQEAIISMSPDTSIFAWELLPSDTEEHWHDLFAPSVANFWWHAQSIRYLPPPSWFGHGEYFDNPGTDHYRLTIRGMHVPFRICQWRYAQKCDVVLAMLNCWKVDRDSVDDREFFKKDYLEAYIICLRVAIQRLAGGSSVMSTHVAAELVLDRDSAARSRRRLALTREYSVQPEIHSLLLRTSLQLPKNIGGVCGYSTSGNVRIHLKFPQALTKESWRVLDVYPNTQWDHSDQSFIFSLADGAALGTILVELVEGLNFIVVLGVVNHLRKSDRSEVVFGRGYLQYWILPWESLPELTGPDMWQLEKHLKSFASKDMFEVRARRQCAAKALHLHGSLDFLGVDCVIIGPPSSETHGAVRRTYPKSLLAYRGYLPSSICLDLDLYLTLGNSQNTTSTLVPYAGLMWEEAFHDFFKEQFRAQSDVSCETVDTHTWYLNCHRLSTRVVDFRSAIFDQKLWREERDKQVNEVNQHFREQARMNELGLGHDYDWLAIDETTFPCVYELSTPDEMDFEHAPEWLTTDSFNVAE